MIELFGLLMFVFPFVFVAALARELANQTNDSRRGWWFLLGAVAALLLNLLYGVVMSEVTKGGEKWTAATFALAMIIPRSIFIVFVSWAMQSRLARRGKPTDTPPKPTI